jgi:hypothetical protein
MSQENVAGVYRGADRRDRRKSCEQDFKSIKVPKVPKPPRLPLSRNAQAFASPMP